MGTKTSNSETGDDTTQKAVVHKDCQNKDDLTVYTETIAEGVGIILCRAFAATSTPNAEIDVDMSWTSELDCGSVSSGPVNHARAGMETEPEEASSSFAPTMAVSVAIAVWLAYVV